MRGISKQLTDIEEHVRIINEEVGELTTKMAIIATELRWIKYFTGLALVLAGASLGLKLI